LKPDNALKHAILLFAVFLALVPSVFMVLTALKSEEEYTFNKVGLPHTVVFDHFENVLFGSPFFAWMANSVILAAGAVAVSTVVSCLGAYAIARMEFKGRGLLFSVSTALMAIPPVVMIVPLFVLYTQLHLISTYEGAILIYAADAENSEIRLEPGKKPHCGVADDIAVQGAQRSTGNRDFDVGITRERRGHVQIVGDDSQILTMGQRLRDIFGRRPESDHE